MEKFRKLNLEEYLYQSMRQFLNIVKAILAGWWVGFATFFW